MNLIEERSKSIPLGSKEKDLIRMKVYGEVVKLKRCSIVEQLSQEEKFTAVRQAKILSSKFNICIPNTGRCDSVALRAIVSNLENKYFPHQVDSRLKNADTSYSDVHRKPPMIFLTNFFHG